ncbi:MAG: hypothetical protein WAV21_00030 [Minisyncoccia bacterium]
MSSFYIQKTIKLGLYKTPDKYYEALNEMGAFYDDRIIGDKEVRKEIRCSQIETEVDLVLRSSADLGFKIRYPVKEVKYRDVCARAVESGFQLCPAEMGPALRLQYKDQSRGRAVYIGMDPIIDREGVNRIFVVGRGYDNGLFWLIGDHIADRYGITVETPLVFICPR